MNAGSLSVVVLSLSILSPFPVPARNAPDTSTHLITLNVAVTGKSGQPVLGLQQQDFSLLDNKQPQAILSFRAPQASVDPPAEVVLVIDEVNTSFHIVASERIQIQKFLSENNGHLARPMSIVFFTDKGASVASEPSQDGNALIAQLHDTNAPLRFIGRSQGYYGAGDRVQLSLNALSGVAAYEMPKPGRKIVVWISPGWPLLSGPREDLTPKAQQDIFNSIVGLSDVLRKANITLYSIDPLGTLEQSGLRSFYYENFLKGVKATNQVQIGDLALQVLARQSGGLALNASNDVAGEIARCVNDVNASYVLTFRTQEADGPNDFHSIDVKVDRPKVTARTRTGYYAQPEPAATH
jgi:VWFA-related protein